jgi:hypothetical protein
MACRAPEHQREQVIGEAEHSGMATKKIIVVPCMVNILLKTWGGTN